MAKMFYSLDEAAEKLGVSEDQIKEMAASGKLQQFRDRDKLMFKRDQVDSMAASQQSAGGLSDSGIPLAGSGDTDTIDLSAEDSEQKSHKPHDAKEATGISVFDASEVDQADPMAQTHVTSSVADDEELALESVGSGSGLLDLTRESDDTSLGADLYDEILPSGSGESSGAGGSGIGSSAAFDSAVGGDTGVSGPSGLENLGASAEAGPSAGAMPAATSMTTSRMAVYDSEPNDPAGSGLGAGFLLGAFAALVIGLIVIIGAFAGIRPGLVTMMTSEENTPLFWMIGLIIGSAILGVIGLVIGKAAAR